MASAWCKLWIINNPSTRPDRDTDNASAFSIAYYGYIYALHFLLHSSVSGSWECEKLIGSRVFLRPVTSEGKTS